MTAIIENYVVRIEQCLPKLLKGIRHFMPKKLLGVKLTFSQEIVLISLHYNEAMKMTKLAAESGVNLTALTGIVDALIAKGYLERRRGSNDRRVVVVDLTKSGRKLAITLQKNRSKSMCQVILALGVKERDQVVNGFEKLVTVLYEQGLKNKKGDEIS